MKSKYGHYLLFTSLSLLVGFLNIGCAPESFSTISPTASSTTTTSLTANNLTFAATVNDQLAIQVSDILSANTAPSGQTLSFQSVGAPSLGQLTAASSAYDFISSTTGTSKFSYTITDTAGAAASATITVQVLPAGAATGAFYACNLQGDLYVLDPFKGTLESLVNLTYDGTTIGMNDLAMDFSSILYGKDLDNNIYQVNVTSGVSTLVIKNLIPSSDIAGGLTVLPNGNFVTTINSSDGGASSVVSINPTTLAETVLVPPSAGYSMYEPGTGETVGDIKYLPDGYLYWTVSDISSKTCASYSGSGNQAIVRIDPTTGATEEIACLNQPDVAGLGYANGALYGFSNGGTLIEINLSTGAINVVDATGDTFVGAASNPSLW
jgi:hypothetical protein